MPLPYACFQVQYLQPPASAFDHLAIVCYPEREDVAIPHISAGTYVYRALLAVSALFLVATLVVYCSVPELRNLHGRCLMSHVAALLTAYSCLLVGQLEPVFSNMAVCQATGQSWTGRGMVTGWSWEVGSGQVSGWLCYRPCVYDFSSRFRM